MTDNGVVRGSVSNKNNGLRVPARLKQLRNSVAPTGDVSFASVYSAYAQSSEISLSTANTTSETTDLFSFDFFAAIAHFFLAAFCATTAYLFGSTSQLIQFGNSTAVAESTNNLDFKGLLYTIGFAIAQGEALVVYRVHRHESKLIGNLLHFMLHLIGLAFAILLLISMIKHENKDEGTYFATFQAWISLIVIACFIIQSLFTLIHLLFPKHSHNLRSNFEPTHKVFAVSIFIISALLTIIGMQQYTGVLGDCYNKFNCMHSLGAFLNVSILCLIVYCVTTTALTTNVHWDRKLTFEDKRKL